MTDSASSSTPPAPILSRTDFEATIDLMIADELPRLFAIVLEYGPGVDAIIAAWGAQFVDRPRLIDVHPALSVPVSVPLTTPESALRWFSPADGRPEFSPRLVWLGPEPTTDPDD